MSHNACSIPTAQKTHSSAVPVSPPTMRMSRKISMSMSSSPLRMRNASERVRASGRRLAVCFVQLWDRRIRR